MVQNCCTNCMGSIGRFLTYVLCCKCCRCCCCGRKEQNKQKIKAKETSKEEIDEAGDGEVYDEYNEDDVSIYNGSSTYGSQPASLKQPEYTGSTTSGIYMSESSLYTSESNIATPNRRREITDNISVHRNKPEVYGSRPNSNTQKNNSEFSGNINSLYFKHNDVKLELSCEIRGAMEIGGKQQPVKGMLTIVPDDQQQPQEIISTLPVHQNNSRKEAFPKQQANSIYNRTPRPLPRAHTNPEQHQSRISEMYLYRNSSRVDEDQNIHDTEHYNTPKPPLPPKNQRLRESSKSNEPIYENTVKIDTKAMKPKNNDRPPKKLQPPRKQDSQIYTIGDTLKFQDHIYEYIDPKDRHRNRNERVDYEIYMSHA